MKKERYIPPLLFLNGHFATIISYLFRPLPQVDYERKRLSTPDKDFIDIDYRRNNSKNAVLVLHGLEGSSQSKSVLGMVHALHSAGFDTIAMNQRGCSGEMNKTYGSYHSGATEDLDFVIKHLIKEYQQLFLVGFSLGGNIVLKYMGEKGEALEGIIEKAIAISVPIHLTTSALKLRKWYNKVYMKRFLKTLIPKAMLKGMWFPDAEMKMGKIMRSKDFLQFDSYYTAPAHGFKDAIDYYEKVQAINFLDSIRRPTLLINALNDSFLSSKCYPSDVDNPFLTLLTPRFGGHVAFPSNFLLRGKSWAEKMTLKFISSK